MPRLVLVKVSVVLFDHLLHCSPEAAYLIR